MEVLDLFYFEECLSIVDLQFDSARFSLEVSAAVGAFGRILLDERNDSRVSIETDVQTHYVAELQKTVEQVQGPHVLDYEVVWEFVVDSDLVKCNHLVHIFVFDLGENHDVAAAHHDVGLQKDVDVFVVCELALNHVFQLVFLVLVGLPLDVTGLLAA